MTLAAHALAVHALAIEIAKIAGERWGDLYRGDYPEIDRIHDLLDDILAITGADRCDYFDAGD